MPARKTTPRGQRCKTCGQVHTKCAGHSKRTKAPCGQPPVPGHDVCKWHGAASPQARAAAAARELEEQTKAAARTAWGIGGELPVEDPLEALLLLAGEVIAWKDYVRDHATKLDGYLTYWVDKDFYGPDGEILRSEAVENARAIVTVYERAQDRAGKVLAAIVKLDIAARMLALRHDQAHRIVQAVRDGLGAVDLEPAVRTAALDAIATQLSKISEPPPQIPKELTA